MFDNPENLSSIEISNKINTMGYGHNRNERCRILGNYSTSLVTKEDWIEKHCIKFTKY